MSQYVETETKTTTTNAYPTETVPTVVGDVKVSQKSYDIQGQVVDSSHDNLIDVNKIHGVQSVGNFSMPSTGLAPIVEQTTVTTSSGSNGSSGNFDSFGSKEPQTNKNPNQTGFPSSDRI